MRNFINKLDQTIFFIPGIFCIPIGGVYQGYECVIKSNSKSYYEHLIHLSINVVKGSIYGGILGTLWPISISSFIIWNALKYSNNLDFEIKYKNLN